MRKKRWIAFLLVLATAAAVLTGCGAKSAVTEKNKRLRVIASNFPCYDFARAAGGKTADVSMLLPPGAESHSYEPTPKDILNIQKCDLFIYVGGDSDAWVDTILEAAGKHVRTLRLIDCVPQLDETVDKEMTTREERSAGEPAEKDEHVWTSPANAAQITAKIAARMEKLDAPNTAAYQANAAAYEKKIRALDSDFRTFFSGVKNKTLVFGDRFPLRYFAEEYGLTCYAAFPGCSTQTEPSAATIAYLTDRVRKGRLHTVYYIEFSNHLVADSIAEASGAKTAQFNSCHNVSAKQMKAGATYVSLMRENLKMLKATMR
jgi:zinc transport system substrate-binding protein